MHWRKKSHKSVKNRKLVREHEKAIHRRKSTNSWPLNTWEIAQSQVLIKEM